MPQTIKNEKLCLLDYFFRLRYKKMHEDLLPNGMYYNDETDLLFYSVVRDLNSCGIFLTSAREFTCVMSRIFLSKSPCILT
jgi:hypothetical protein